MKNLSKNNICGLNIKDFEGPGLNFLESGAIYYELGKGEPSLATFVAAHGPLGIYVIDRLGNEEQRKRFVPDGIKLNKIFCFGLTEPDYGSDATGLKTIAKKVEGGYILNG